MQDALSMAALIWSTHQIGQELQFVLQTDQPNVCVP